MPPPTPCCVYWLAGLDGLTVEMGNAVGALDGNFVGGKLFRQLGEKDGDILGFFDGTFDGLFVTVTVGLLVVGEMEGNFVDGFGVGFFEGAVVLDILGERDGDFEGVVPAIAD
mmetsp:Transcript_30487/g.43717  ORF Transcript_30487/g.43717 Transcript_30487/m.43717 type:complete len:113 (+) Transcript_30487:323-661(+)